MIYNTLIKDALLIDKKRKYTAKEDNKQNRRFQEDKHKQI